MASQGLGRARSTSEEDKAAQRRASILAKSEDRMKRVLGLQAQADHTEETSTESSAATSTTTAEQPRAGATRRNRRLQSRSISITAPPSAVALTASEAVTAAADIGRVEEPAPETVAGEGAVKESSVATAEEQAGEVKLRRRFQARTGMEGQVSNFQPSEGGQDHDVDDAKTAALRLTKPASARGQRPGLLTAFWTLDAAAKEAVIRVLLIALTGALTGMLLLLSNADDLRASASKGCESGALPHVMRSKLLDYVEQALLHRDLETLHPLSNWRAWIWSRVFPERFESLPLPIIAVALHLLVVLFFSALSSRPRAARGESQGAKVARLVSGHSAGAQPGEGDGEPDKPKSMVESVAANLGLGGVLSAFQRLQSVLLDVQIFLFFFISVVAVGHVIAVLT